MAVRNIALFSLSFLVFTIVIGYAMKGANKPSVNVLMVGNSITYYNDMPDMLEKMLNHDGSNAMYYNIDTFTKGGETLINHSKNSRLIKKLENGQYQHVIFQEQSTAMFYSNERPDSLRAFNLLTSRARNNNANAYIFMTFPRANNNRFWKDQKKGYSNLTILKDPKHMGEALINFYRQAKGPFKTNLVPITYYWMDAMDTNLRDRLYNPDGNHPSLEGSYFMALIIYKSIMGEMPPADIWAPDSISHNDKERMIALIQQKDYF